MPAPGGVTWWFKQDEIHQATHVHRGPEFLPWHREMVNRLEEMLRQINPQLSLHYWDWTQDPRRIRNANLGEGRTGDLNLFTPDFMGYGGLNLDAGIGDPWLRAGYYDPAAQREGRPFRDDIVHQRGAPNSNPADPPLVVRRCIGCIPNGPTSPASVDSDAEILNAVDYADMRRLLEPVHNDMHMFVYMGQPHLSFRDPFVFLLHSKGIWVEMKDMMWFVKGKQKSFDNDIHNFIESSKPDKDKHPWAQSSVEAEYIVKSMTVSEDSLVLDPFMGSGAFVIPAVKLNRWVIGIDIDKQVVENAVNYIKSSCSTTFGDRHN